MLGVLQSFAGVCDCLPSGKCPVPVWGRGRAPKTSPGACHTPPSSLSVHICAVGTVTAGAHGCCERPREEGLAGLTCRCSVNVCIPSFEVFFVTSEEDEAVTLTWWLPPQGFPSPPQYGDMRAPLRRPGHRKTYPAPAQPAASWGAWSPLPHWACGGEWGGLHLLRRGQNETGTEEHSRPSLLTLQPAQPTPLQRWGRGGMGWRRGRGQLLGTPYRAGQQSWRPGPETPQAVLKPGPGPQGVSDFPGMHTHCHRPHLLPPNLPMEIVTPSASGYTLERGPLKR